MHVSSVLALTALLACASGAPLPVWSWRTVSTFVHCSNSSGPLNAEILNVMAGTASFTVIEKYQCLACAPTNNGGEQKQLAAARAIRALNPNATIVLYFAVDYARTWYALGHWFDAHPELEVHNADGTLATVNSEGYTWHVFDFSTTLGSYAWVMTIADTVATPDEYGNAMFDGVFIDGYRGPGGWANQLIPKANATTQSAWIAGVNRTGPLLEEALGAGTIRLQNPYEPSFPGYNSFSIEFFDWSVDSIKNLIYAGTAGFKMAEIHTYAGADVGKFNLTLAAYLVGVWPGAYFGAGSQWSQCDDWLLPHTEYERPLGEPVGPATFNDGVWTRSFNGGATKVVLNSTAGTSCISWGDGYTTGNNC